MADMTDLDKIISDGKIKPETAMAIFAFELRSQGDKIDTLTATLKDDNQRYAPTERVVSAERRISRLENAVIAFLVIIALAVLTAVLSLVVTKGGK